MLDENLTITLKAVVNTVIPADAYPDGWTAGVGDYLFRQFERDLADDLLHYQAWLSSLNAEAAARHNKSFADLDLDTCTALLQAVESGQVQTEWTIDAAAFFQQVIEHCAEGFYSNPENGGNKDQIAWQMIGFEVTG